MPSSKKRPPSAGVAKTTKAAGATRPPPEPIPEAEFEDLIRRLVRTPPKKKRGE